MSVERPKIQWASGFLRVWCVFLVLWAIPSFYYNYEPKYSYPAGNLHIGDMYFDVDEKFYNINNEEKQKSVDEIISSKHENIEGWPTEADRKSWSLTPRIYLFKSLLYPIECSLGPPIAILIIGVMIGWAISGFKRV